MDRLMKVYIADEASPTVSRYKNVGKAPFSVRLLLTANGSPGSRARIIMKACHALEPRSLFVDSGAFIYRSALTGKKSKSLSDLKKLSVADMEDVIRSHLGACKWLHEQGYPLVAVAEMDLPDIYGMDTIWKWRDAYFIPFQEQTGVPVVFAWHGEEFEPMEELISHSFCEYTALSMAINKTFIKQQYGTVDRYYDLIYQMVDMCYSEGVRVHGYAVTRTSALKEVPFYSVDSVSWQQALHFGGALAFDKATGELVRVDLGRGFVKRKGLKAAAKNLSKLQKYGCRLTLLDVLGRTDLSGKLRSNHKAIFLDQAKVFADMEEWFTRYWKRRGYDWEMQLGEEPDSWRQAVSAPPRRRKNLICFR